MQNFNLKIDTPIKKKVINLIQYINGILWTRGENKNKQMLTSVRVLEHIQNKESDFVYAWRANQMPRDFKKLSLQQKMWLVECLCPCVIEFPFCWV